MVDFYGRNRNSLDQIYPSERAFLSSALRPDCRVLDVGCAAGGFSDVLREIEPRIDYVGADQSVGMIEQAKRVHPADKFVVAAGEDLPFGDREFDLVISFGTLHMTVMWRRVLAECWRTARENFIFDLRLNLESGSLVDPETSYQYLDFGGKRDQKVAYVVLGIEEVLAEFSSLQPAPEIHAFGYLHDVAPTVVSSVKQVCMAGFRLAKRGASASARVAEWQLPIELPGGISVEA